MKKIVMCVFALILYGSICHAAEGRFQFTDRFLTDTEAGIVYKFDVQCQCFRPVMFHVLKDDLTYYGYKASQILIQDAKGAEPGERIWEGDKKGINQ
jgi:hypothetical protein